MCRRHLGAQGPSRCHACLTSAPRLRRLGIRPPLTADPEQAPRRIRSHPVVSPSRVTAGESNLIRRVHDVERLIGPSSVRQAAGHAWHVARHRRRPCPLPPRRLPPPPPHPGPPTGATSPRRRRSTKSCATTSAPVPGVRRSLLVAFSCKGRVFARRVWDAGCARPPPTSSSVLPQTGLRQWVLRSRSRGGAVWRTTALWSAGSRASSRRRCTRPTPSARRRRASAEPRPAVTVLQRTSSDLRLNPHLHLVALDGAYHEQGTELAWEALGHLKTSEVLERAAIGGVSIDRPLARRPPR